MRTILAIVLIILLGIALGVGVATLRIRATPWKPPRDDGQDARPLSSQSGQPAHNVVIDQTRFLSLARFAVVD
jgi:uncharacterized protein YneF (UPF0154 family)